MDTAFIPAPSGIRIARWVDANSIAGYGRVTAVGATAVPIVLTRGYPGSVRVLCIERSTVVAAAAGKTVAGQVGSLRVGNDVYFTGATDTAAPQDTNVWAYRLFQLGMPTAGPQLPATGAGGLATDRSAAPTLGMLLLMGALLSTWLGRYRFPHTLSRRT